MFMARFESRIAAAAPADVALLDAVHFQTTRGPKAEKISEDEVKTKKGIFSFSFHSFVTAATPPTTNNNNNVNDDKQEIW